MSTPNPDDLLLLIRCPSCGQRFKVGDDLRGRTVECGGCEHRFRITDEVIVRGKKFYPGERKDPRLNRFQRVPLAVSPAVMGGQTIRYAEPPDPTMFEPAPPQRIVAGIVGATGMVLMALLLIFGASRGGTLDGMTTTNRMLMGGFTGLLGLSLLIYANPRARMKAFLVGILMAGGLLAIPMFFTAGSVPLDGESSPVVEAPGARDPVDEAEAEQTPEQKLLDDLRYQIGTGPLEDEIERLGGPSAARTARGIWLKDLRGENRFLVMDYILRATGADPSSHFYPRDTGNYLLVVTGITQTLDEFAEVAKALGTLERIYPELSVVEIRVNNQDFIEGPIEKLNDRSDPAFYDLNKRELESIDLARVSKAVRRLAEAEPKVYRSDVTRKLIQLLDSPGVTFKGDICRALATWSEQPGPAGEAALKQAAALLSQEEKVPEEMIALIVKEQNLAVIPIIDELWSADPNTWEDLYGDVGAAAEETLIHRFNTSTEALQRRSAARLLGRVGGPGSLPLLEQALTGADAELRVLLEKAIASVRSRTGG
jgi:predicted Zn finger-like uncharacterized protein